MCGIAGYIHFNKERAANKSLLKKMTDIIVHRGPDGEGFYINKNLALGHRRLSILDLATGDQPMLSDDGKKIITFNGEIYNFLDLKAELKGLGHKFKTNSDTEVIIKSYEEWGIQCQNKFNGMWAFALWDSNLEQLFLSRDRIGEKPLFFSNWNESFVFGSEIKSLFEFGIEKRLRIELIELYLTLTNIPAPNTFFKGIYKLMPGNYLIIKDGKLTEKKYWDFPEIDENNMLKNKKEIYDTFEFLFNDSVKLRMKSDVSFGAFLSGGLDSGSIVASMSQFSNYPIKTFTIGFEDKAFDESKLANDVATKFKTDHFLGAVQQENFDSLINFTSFHYDEPFGDSSAIPTGYVSKFASQKVKMVLTGDGGDEILSGYTSYQGIKLSNIINQFPKSLKTFVPFTNDYISSFFTGNIRYKLNKISEVIKSSELPFNERMAAKMPFTSLSLIKELTKDIKSKINIEEYLADLMNSSKLKDDFYKLMFLHFSHNLPNDYLVKVDRMSMAYNLEARVPFLDYRLIEFMFKVDKNIKMEGWQRKSILRNTIGKKLPNSVLKAPKKGFGIPLREWFKDNSFDGYVNNNLGSLTRILDKKILEEIVFKNKTGEKDNGNFIWTMMMLNKCL